MKHFSIVFFVATLGVQYGLLAQRPGETVEKILPATTPSTQADKAVLRTQGQPPAKLAIEPSENAIGEKLGEFVGRKDVLKSATSLKPGEPFFTSVELKLPEEFLHKGPAYRLYLSLSVIPPSKGATNLVVRIKEEPKLVLFRTDINKEAPDYSNVVRQNDGWITLQFLTISLREDTKSIVIELSADAVSKEDSFAYWEPATLSLVSKVVYEEVDPTKQTIFQGYRDMGTRYQLVDALSGRVLKHGIGIEFAGSKTTCLFSKDGSHVAIISTYHERQRSGDTDFEQLWFFALKPFQQLQEVKSRQFRDIHFDQDNKTLIFQSDGKPRIDGP